MEARAKPTVGKQIRLPFAPSSAAKLVEDRGSEEHKGTSAAKPNEKRDAVLESLDESGEGASSAGKPDDDDENSLRTGAEDLTLSDLRSRLECKSSLPLVAQFLDNLRIFEE